MKNAAIDGTAVVLCEGHFGTSDGKTAHGLVRHTDRYRILAVIDSTLAGRDAGEALDGRSYGIPIVKDLAASIRIAPHAPEFLVVGVATHGGVLPANCRPIVREALASGMHVDSGLHELLGDDPEFAELSRAHGARIRDVRRTPPRQAMHAFTGDIATVTAVRLAVLGTDSAVGKRTTAVRLVQALNDAGRAAVLIGTGQTSWMQGARYSLILDSLVNDFVSGEIEHQVVRAFREARPEFIVIEGQGCLTNPAYPGGFEILAGARPDGVIMQHAPARAFYDGFPGFPLAGVAREAEIIRLLSGAPLLAIALNHEGLGPGELQRHRDALATQFGVPCCDPLIDGLDPVLTMIGRRFPPRSA